MSVSSDPCKLVFKMHSLVIDTDQQYLVAMELYTYLCVYLFVTLIVCYTLVIQ